MEYLQIILVSIIGCVLTYFISFQLKKGVVMGSAVVTLLSGLLYPYFFIDGILLAAASTCASYAAMVSLEKFPKIWEMCIVGLLAGCVFITATNVFVGVGGRLGAIAAISGIAWCGMKRIIQLINKSKKEVKVK